MWLLEIIGALVVIGLICYAIYRIITRVEVREKEK